MHGVSHSLYCGYVTVDPILWICYGTFLIYHQFDKSYFLIGYMILMADAPLFYFISFIFFIYLFNPPYLYLSVLFYLHSTVPVGYVCVTS